MTVQNIYQRDLEKNPANFEALTPISFLGRAERVYPDYPALIHGSLSQSWGETARRCRQLASALRLRGIGRGIPSPSLRPISRRCLKHTSGCP